MPEINPDLNALIAVDEQLAHLVLLTERGIKPLSRWEKPLSADILSIVNGPFDLLTAEATRTTANGNEVREHLFSRSQSYLDLYIEAFDRQPISRCANTQRIEGFLFGYPPCCVEQFIRRPYAPNRLDEVDQRILFHWACKDCRMTRLLLPLYRTVHELVGRRVNGRLTSAE